MLLKNRNRLIRGLTNSPQAAPALLLPADPTFLPGTADEDEQQVREALYGGQPSAAVTEFLTILVLSWRHTATMIPDNRTYRPDMVRSTPLTSDLPLIPTAKGVFRVNADWGVVEPSNTLRLTPVGNTLKIEQGAGAITVPLGRGQKCVPDLHSIPGLDFVIALPGSSLVDGQPYLVNGAQAAYPCSVVRTRLDTLAGMQSVLLRAGANDLFYGADSDEEAVAVASAALAFVTLVRTNF